MPEGDDACCRLGGEVKDKCVDIWVIGDVHFDSGEERLHRALHPQQDADQADSAHLQQDQQVHLRLPEHRGRLRDRELPGDQPRSHIGMPPLRTHRTRTTLKPPRADGWVEF